MYSSMAGGEAERFDLLGSVASVSSSSPSLSLPASVTSCRFIASSSCTELSWFAREELELLVVVRPRAAVLRAALSGEYADASLRISLGTVVVDLVDRPLAVVRSSCIIGAFR